jgi:general secretion pathway protein G
MFDHQRFQVRGFSLMEILIVIAIMGILGAVIVGVLTSGKDKAFLARAKLEFRSLSQSLELYKIDNGGYPADVNRGLPNGLEAYLPGGNWPNAPWPGSVYDWDNWDIDGEQVVQFSVRFCDIDETDPENCPFPKDEWAADFDVNSAVYFCIEGSCRSHDAQPVDYPGYCINCDG